MVSRSGDASMKNIQFYTQRRVEFGQAVYVSGSHSILGDWDLKRAQKLVWSKGDNWKVMVKLPVPLDLEYKFVISTDDPADMHYQLWDMGPNAKLSLFPDTKEMQAFKGFAAMSFNIRYDNEGDGMNKWQFRKDLVANTMKLYSCDFIGVQEALQHQLADLTSMLPNYMYYGRGRGEHFTSGEASPIFYLHQKWELIEGNTFWLSDMPEVPASTTFGNTIPRICTWAIFKHKLNDCEVFVMNTHIDHTNANSQRESAKLLASFLLTISLKYNRIVLMGDFNAIEDDESIEIVKRDGPKLRDTFADIHVNKKDRREMGTFHYWMGIRDSIRIDYVFASPALKAKDVKIIYDNIKGKYPSDHFPITCSFSS